MRLVSSGKCEEATGRKKNPAPTLEVYPENFSRIRFNKEGVGVGKMSVRTKITMTKDKKSIELENYGIEPVRLTEVRIEK